MRWRHHRLLHEGHIENADASPESWKVAQTPRRCVSSDARKEAVDAKYREHVRAAARVDNRLADELAPDDDLAPEEQAATDGPRVDELDDVEEDAA